MQCILCIPDAIFFFFFFNREKELFRFLSLICFSFASATLVDSSLPDLSNGATQVEVGLSGELATFAQFINTTHEFSIAEDEFVAKAVAFSPSERRRLSSGSA